MDLLSLANYINTELVSIQSQYGDVFEQQNPGAIFNSIVSCITDDLAETITFQLLDRHDPQHALLSWEYDLHDRQYLRRMGPTLAEILQNLQNTPRKSAQLLCTTRWSQHFESLNSQEQERSLRYTIWEKHRGSEQGQLAHADTYAEPASPGSVFSVRAVDIQLLQDELSQLASETPVINQQAVGEICENVKRCRSADHIQGIRCELRGNGRSPALEWEYTFSSEEKLVREGPKVEQILSVARVLKGQPVLLTRPVQTASFKKLSTKIQQEVMKDTIWASTFRKWYLPSR